MKTPLEEMSRRWDGAPAAPAASPAPDRALTTGGVASGLGLDRVLTTPARGVPSAGRRDWLGRSPGSRRRGPWAVAHSWLPAAWHPLR